MDNISKCVNDHLQQKAIGQKRLCWGLNFSYLSISAIVVCVEGLDDVLSTPCSSGKWVELGGHLVSDTWWLLSRN